tara:strand:- start:66 stop:746 length:681 start_codon:yes stop_codon:yes gene_type:complete
MGTFTGPDIVKDNLVFAIDAGSARSYPGSGTVATDLVGTDNGTLTNGVTYSTANGGVFENDGVDSFIQFDIPITVTSPYTILLWLKPDTLGTGTSSARSTPLIGRSSAATLWNPGIWATTTMMRSHCASQYADSTIDWSGLGYAQFGMIYNGGSVLNVFNGEILTNFNTAAYNPGNTNTSIVWGAEGTSGTNAWDGPMASQKMYNVAFTAAQIKQDYNAFKSRFGL